MVYVRSFPEPAANTMASHPLDRVGHVLGQISDDRLGTEVFDVGLLGLVAAHSSSVAVALGRQSGDVSADLSVGPRYEYVHESCFEKGSRSQESCDRSRQTPKI
jgi:hypothetical protein